MNSLVVLGFILILLNNMTYGHKYNACELARALDRLGVPRNELSDWVCLAHYASGLDANKVHLNNPDGSWDWGLFQINDEEWCSNTQRKRETPMVNRCGIDCIELLYDLHANIRCGQLLKQTIGFEASIAWRTNCASTAPSVLGCNELH